MNNNLYDTPSSFRYSTFVFVIICLGIQTTNADETLQNKGEKPSFRDVEQISGQQNKENTLLPGAAGMKLHINRQTGEIVTPSGKEPPAKLPSAAQEKMFSTSSKGLIKRPSDIPGGGESVYLQGRFMSPLTLKIGPEGKKSIEHTGHLAQQPEQE